MKTAATPLARMAGSVLHVISVISLIAAVSASAQSLVFHYDFDDVGAGSAVDSSANGWDLALQGTAPALGTAGGRTGVLNLNATAQANPNAAINKNVSGLAAPLTQYTVTGWLFRPEGSSSLGGQILSLGLGTGRVFVITLESNGSLLFQPNAADGNRSVATAVSSDWTTTGQWIFFAVTVDSTSGTPGTNWNNAIKLYTGNETDSGLTRINNTGLGGSGSVSQYAIADISTVSIGNSFNSAINPTTTNRALRENISLDDIRLYDGVLDEAALDAIRLSVIPEPASVALLMGLGGLIIAFTTRQGRK